MSRVQIVSPEYARVVADTADVRIPPEGPEEQSSTPTLTSARIRKRTTAVNPVSGTASCVAPGSRVPTVSWRFVITDEALQRSVELPLIDDRQAEAVVAAEFKRQRIRDLKPRQLLDALARVVTRPLPQRQLIRKLAGMEPEGWKIVSVGCYRLLLDIDEQLHHVRCLVRHRREAYRRKYRR